MLKPPQTSGQLDVSWLVQVTNGFPTAHNYHANRAPSLEQLGYLAHSTHYVPPLDSKLTQLGKGTAGVYWQESN
jgi:hypothetical protein